MDQTSTIFWFRRDLRLEDNAGLYHALRNESDVVCLFIFDIEILNDLEDEFDKRVTFIYDSLQTLKKQLEEKNTSLLILYGNPVDIFSEINPKAVYTNRDYEPYARRRDESVQKVLALKGCNLHLFKDQVIFDTNEILKDSGDPYTIFTPYSRRWKSKLNKFYAKSYPVEKYFRNFKLIPPLPMPSLEEVGFKRAVTDFPERIIKLKIIQEYDKQRDFPAIRGTSRLSIHLRFGTLSIRKVVQIALKKNEVWLNELIWRDFYHMILWYFPRVENNSFKPAYDKISWRNNLKEFKAWCEGKTGYPIVDAGMRELNETGFMHNRVRMITASFLTKHLLIDWRWGEAYFAKKLLDYDMAANNGGWQWAAGCGCDAAPYFRVFNPELQAEKYDPDHKYVKAWLKEYGTDKYPCPIIEHKFARERALKVYKKALE
ncbi:DNA photolyase family protein [Fulvivirgaceae bacterium PWU20]|uniref:DNA photolyase family protein n=2 Tax=Chryseosolibacter indicus TaxID=2782351 RepID=A0ABS5VXV8_9BACT|nr:DNA photolyase family protein [Chryseosolibacter indicus]